MVAAIRLLRPGSVNRVFRIFLREPFQIEYGEIAAGSNKPKTMMPKINMLGPQNFQTTETPHREKLQDFSAINLKEKFLSI